MDPTDPRPRDISVLCFFYATDLCVYLFAVCHIYRYRSRSGIKSCNPKNQSSPGMKSMSADMFLDLPTMSAPSGEERRTGASAQVERAGLCLPLLETVHNRVYGCTAEAAASESSGLRRWRLRWRAWAVPPPPVADTRTNSRTDEIGVRTNNFSH